MVVPDQRSGLERALPHRVSKVRESGDAVKKL
jgi:hypothetical protein